MSPRGTLIVARRREALEKQRHRARLDWLARHDALTGLPNRAALEEALQARPPAAGALLAVRRNRRKAKGIQQ